MFKPTKAILKKEYIKMSYAIIRNTNYKLKNLSGIYRHNERKNTNYSNKDIKKENGINNYSIKKPNTTYEKIFKELRKKYDLKGQIKNVSNVMCEFIITSDKEFFERIGEKETKRFFEVAYKFVANYKKLGEEYIVSSKVHMDESTPQMHIVFIPVVHKKDKKGNEISKIACSEYWKGKDSYKRLQDNFYEYIKKAGFDLERGKERKVEHLSTEKLKQVTDYDNIKFELENEKIEPVDTKNTALIIAQNQQLVKYVNRLKLQLSKSYRAINKFEQLKTENIRLKIENENLKKENHKLKNYINKTFEVVKYLFEFPIDSFKRIVDKFIKLI